MIFCWLFSSQPSCVTPHQRGRTQPAGYRKGGEQRKRRREELEQCRIV
ncbi:hypothetical protein [Enterobacter hormaechei]|nr:hypothetical protein [Enterobacter hormaechei]